MALFGKKKKAAKAEKPEEIEEVTTDIGEADAQESEADSEMEAEENAVPQLSPEERFKKACGDLGIRLRQLFPQQMLIGFYYAEMQSGGYIDDFCCYATNGKLLDRQSIPRLCGLSLPDMVSREERLEKAFLTLREAAPEATGKPCNAVNIVMMGNGSVKIDIVSSELVDGEEEERYGKWLKRVEASKPRPAAPQISPERLKKIQEKTAEKYKELGTEFYSFLPGEDFKIAYFYAESGENGFFYFHRLITAEGEIIDGDELFERYEMDREEAEKNRVAIVQLIMEIMQIFTSEGQKPFSSITLSVSGGGEFKSELGFGPTDAAGEQARLEEWKAKHTD